MPRSLRSLIRILAAAALLTALAGCASWYGKSSDPDANRLVTSPQPQTSEPIDAAH